MKKVCYVCKEEKPLEKFSKNKARKDGLQTYCRDCRRTEQTKWYFQRKYGMSLEERDRMLEEQDYKCAICNSKVKFRDKPVHGKSDLPKIQDNIGTYAVIDHCHESETIRGVLCGHCNVGLGAFKDNIKSLRNAIKYLKNSGKD